MAARVSVFKQVTHSLFEWYRAATPEEIEQTGQYILLAEVLSYDELWDRLENYE